MKKLINSSIKCLFLFGMFMLTQNLQASVQNSLTIEKGEEGKTLKLQINTRKSDQYQVRILDAEDIILHQESITVSKRFTRKYILEQLPKGQYTFVIENKLSKIIQPIQITVSDLDIDHTLQREVFKPVIRLKNNKLDIDLMVLNQPTVKLELFDADFERIYSGRFEDFGRVFGKRLDLSKIARGKYILKLKAGDEVFNEVIKVN